MSHAQVKLHKEIVGLRESSDLPILADHNIGVEARRQMIGGIAISAFVAVEEFVKSRIDEVSSESLITHFSELPAGGRKMLLERSVANYRRRFSGAEGEESELLKRAEQLAKTFNTLSGAPLVLSPLVLGWSRSNLQKEDIFDMFQVLGLDVQGWYPLNEVYRRSRPRDRQSVELGPVFEQLVNARHGAAHNSNTEVSVTVVRSLADSVLAICMSVDILLSHAIWRLRVGLDEVGGSADRVCKISFCEPVKGRFRCIDEGRKKGWRYDTVTEAKAYALSRRRTVIELDVRGQVIGWASVV